MRRRSVASAAIRWADAAVSRARASSMAMAGSPAAISVEALRANWPKPAAVSVSAAAEDAGVTVRLAPNRSRAGDTAGVTDADIIATCAALKPAGLALRRASSPAGGPWGSDIICSRGKGVG